MPFSAIWTRSQRGQLSADYESISYPGNTFIFLQKRKTQQCSYFRCAHCAKAMKLRSRRGATKLTVPIVRATLEEGFIDDPDSPFHRHFCVDEEGVDTSTFAAKARYVYNKVKLELLEMPMTPRQAMAYMEAEVVANFPDPVTQQEIIRRLPSDKSAKRSFARRSSVAKKTYAGDFPLFEGDDFVLDDDALEDGGETSENNDPRNIPSELLKPFSPRPPWICSPGREHLANFFLIYRDPRAHGRPFLVFADIMGMNLLHKCSDIVCDGNSNFYPHGFAQLYTFHAVHNSIPEEAHLAAFALLPNTAPQTYLKLFDIISERMVAEYGSFGVRKNWHFDNQPSAINGCRAIFVDDVVEGSEQRTANFAQLWHDHLGSLFFGSHPDLTRFIRVMREELARASIQAERIFKRPAPIKQINLDNLEHIRNYPLKNGFDYTDYYHYPMRSISRTKGIARYALYEQMYPSPYFTSIMGQRRRKRKQRISVEEAHQYLQKKLRQNSVRQQQLLKVEGGDAGNVDSSSTNQQNIVVNEQSEESTIREENARLVDQAQSGTVDGMGISGEGNTGISDMIAEKEEPQTKLPKNKSVHDEEEQVVIDIDVDGSELMPTSAVSIQAPGALDTTTRNRIGKTRNIIGNS